MKLRVLSALVLLGLSSSVSAGPFNDKLAICLVENTSQADKATLMRWIFGAMSRHPGVEDLLTDRCATETQQAVKYEGAAVISSSFEVLGKVAMQGLMSDPAVQDYMGGLERNIEPGKLDSILKGAK